MPKFEDQLSVVQAIDRQAWRSWLIENHQSAPGIWLMYYKVKSGKPSVQYAEAVQEALCFGWIDSKVQSIDAESYRQIFTPRKPGSVWSKLNKQYIEALIAQGLMTAAGLAKIEAAKQDGSWCKLDAIEALIVPDDLQQALDADFEASRAFTAFSNSTKKIILTWIDAAKRPETRARRIASTIESARQHRSPLQPAAQPGTKPQTKKN